MTSRRTTLALTVTMALGCTANRADDFGAHSALTHAASPELEALFACMGELETRWATQSASPTRESVARELELARTLQLETVQLSTAQLDAILAPPERASRPPVGSAEPARPAERPMRSATGFDDEQLRNFYEIALATTAAVEGESFCQDGPEPFLALIEDVPPPPDDPSDASECSASCVGHYLGTFENEVWLALAELALCDGSTDLRETQRAIFEGFVASTNDTLECFYDCILVVTGG